MKCSPVHPTIRTLDKRALQAVMRMIARMEQKDQPEIFAHVHPHAHATARLARLFAAFCGCDSGSSGVTLAEIEYGAQMHDIGKYFIIPSVTLKPGALDDDEEAVMRLHSVYGAMILSKLPGTTESIHRAVLYHHEHWAGTGYPEGLRGVGIPLAARIISVVDVYTALRARRSYKETLTKSEAIKTLIEMAGRELDPYLVEDFVKLLGHQR
jgi:HD-GYP domain-containing protein (c-di-GMP phosphodiesterase class II)